MSGGLAGERAQGGRSRTRGLLEAPWYGVTPGRGQARFVIRSPSMNRRTTEADGQARVVRAAETKFLVERYHRAFQDEAEYLRGLVKVWLVREHRSIEARSVEVALQTMCTALAEHVTLQETVIFPAFERTGHCGEPLVERGTADCAALFAAINGLRDVCAVDPSERPSSTDARLRVRLVHLANEIQQHLADELRLLLTDGIGDTLPSPLPLSLSSSSSSAGHQHPGPEAPGVHRRKHRQGSPGPRRNGRRFDDRVDDATGS